MNEQVTEIMKDRIQYLGSKPIHELTDEELKEFMAIRNFIKSQFQKIADVVMEAAERNVNEYHEMIKEYSK